MFLGGDIALQAKCGEFDPLRVHHFIFWDIAQLAEQVTVNHRVLGSTPSVPAIFHLSVRCDSLVIDPAWNREPTASCG